MIPIAGVLLVIILVFSVAVVVSNPEVFDLSIFGATIPVTTAGVYFTGAGAMLVLILAAALLRRGLRRELARRKQVRALQNAAGVKSLPTSAGAKGASGSKVTGAARGPGHASTSRQGRSGAAEPEEQRPNAEPVPAGRASSSTTAGGAREAGQANDRSSTTTAKRTGASGGAAASSDGTDGSTPEAGTTFAERQALLDEAEELTGDSSDR